MGIHWRFSKEIEKAGSRILQRELLTLKKRYCGQHFWLIGGYGACSTDDVTDEMVQEHREYHRHRSNADKRNIILD